MAATRREAFTIIELLIVISIILILAVTVMPNIGAGISGTQLAATSRSLVQAARFARTMALLHQVEMELSLTSAAEGLHSVEPGRDGKPPKGVALIEVRLANSAGLRGSDVPVDGAVPAESGADAADEAFADESGTGGPTARESTDTALGDFAEGMHSVFACGLSRFEFSRFLDDDGDSEPEPRAPSGDAGAPADGEGGEESRNALTFRFEADGTCRPFEVRVRDGEDGPAFTIRVDRWGKGEVLRDEG